MLSGDLEEGDYVIYYEGKAMNNTVNSNRLQYEEVSPENDIIKTTNNAIVWHIAPDGDYWTIQSLDNNKYAASTGSKNQATVMDDGTDDKALWTVSGTETYEFVNKQNASSNINANLRNNGNYGFACYATGTGGALSLYKYESVKKPVISPAGGEFYTSQEVTITADEGCSIYYTTNGNNPTTESTEYTEPFTLLETTTVKAIAVKDGETSSVVTAEFIKVSPVLAVDPYTIEVGAEGDNGTLSIIGQHFNVEDVTSTYIEFFEPNTSTTLSTIPDWIHLSVDIVDETISYTVDQNTSTEERVAQFKLAYSFGNEEELLSDVVTFTQAGYVASQEFELFSGNLEEGYYVIYYEGKAMNNKVENDRLQYEVVTPDEDNIIKTNDKSIIWYIAPAGDYWTIQSLENDKYAASTGTKNKATVIDMDNGTYDKALWSVSGTETYEFVNKKNEIDAVNAYLRNNGEYGFACYAEDTGGDLSLYRLKPFIFTISDQATDGKTCYATIADLGEGYYKVANNVEVHTVAVVDGKISYRSDFVSGDIIPGDGAYLVEGNATQHKFHAVKPKPETPTSVAGDNMLYSTGEGSLSADDMATTPTQEATYKFYKLSLRNGRIGFYWGADQGAPFNYNSDHQAFLAVPQTGETGQGAAAYFFDGDTTGIYSMEAMESGNDKGDTFTLSGIRVDNKQLPKGIYIQNGKKVIVK